MGELCGIPLVLAHPRFLVVQKPAGLLSQPGLGPHQQDSLITRLQCGCQQLRLVHRLDRDTSGLVVVARDPDSLRDLSALFAARQVHKLYLADVVGAVGKLRGCQDQPLARLERHPPRYGPHPDGKPCCTLWRRQARMPGATRLWLRPLTGRSHQLRAHLAAMGTPIVGDPIYGVSDGGGSGPMRLHALALSFPNLDGQGRVRVRAQLPSWAQAENRRLAGIG